MNKLNNGLGKFAKLTVAIGRRVSNLERPFQECPLSLSPQNSKDEVKNLKIQMKGAFILGLVLIASVASMAFLSVSLAANGDADQTRDRIQDQLQEDCQQNCVGDRVGDQARDRTQDQDSTGDCTGDCAQDRSQDRTQDCTQDCTCDGVGDQTRLQTRQQTRDC